MERARRSSSGRSRTATSSTRRSTPSPTPPLGGQREHPPEVDRARDVRALRELSRLRAQLGLERSEGVLLRYLSQVYKTLAQTVPAAARSDEVMDILAHFRALRARGRLQPARGVGGAQASGGAGGGAGGGADRRRPGGRAARARGEHPRRGPPAWSARSRSATKPGPRASSRPAKGERLDRGANRRRDGPVLGRPRRDLTTPDARRSERTRIDELGPGRFRVQQTLVDPEGDEDWSLDGIVDVNGDRPEGAPRFELGRVGV